MMQHRNIRRAKNMERITSQWPSRAWQLDMRTQRLLLLNFYPLTFEVFLPLLLWRGAALLTLIISKEEKIKKSFMRFAKNNKLNYSVEHT